MQKKRQSRIIRNGLLGAASALASIAAADARELYVDKAGDDTNDGSENAPFKTISKAAAEALPGDKVVVREGIYREWVRPARGGASADKRIIYQAEDGDDVRIVGSEVISNWELRGDYWLARVPNTLFGDFNPFATLTRHPIPVEVDEAGDGWGWLKYGRWTHLGDVYINGEGLTERKTADGLKTPLSWRATVDENETLITANFGDHDPRRANIEINVRPYGFFPEKSGLSYITFRGFTVMNVASHWAPPTVYQAGAIGSNGGNHWIIEDNSVLYAKGLCISIGIPTGDADFEKRGHHIIRNNVLLRCGQGGIAGQSWNNRSLIEGNHIEDVNYRREFGGWETAGIKFHNGEDIIIRGNFIRNVATQDPEIGAAHGIWIDFQNRNFRISRNVVIGAQSNAIYFEANWDGPMFFDQNIIIGGKLATASSRGEAWLHNLFIDTTSYWENQDWQDRPTVKHARWRNNIFISGGLKDAPDDETIRFSHNVFINGAEPNMNETNGRILPGNVSFSLIDRKKKLVLDLEIPRQTPPLSVAPVDVETLELPFKENEDLIFSIEHDFIQQRRRENTAPGPFDRALGSTNRYTLWRYSPRYRAALKHIDLD